MNVISTLFSVFAKIWCALPNRLVALVVFLGGVGAIFWLYASFFVLDVSIVVFSVSGVASAEVRLTGSYKAAGMYGAISGGTGATCPGSCSFAKLPPVRYDWSASADGYETSTGSFDLPPRTAFPVSVAMSPAVRYEAHFPDNARRAAEARVRRDLDAFASGAIRYVGKRILRDAPSSALSGAVVWLPAGVGRAVLKCDACDGGWAWWGAGRWAPLFPGQSGMAAVSGDAEGGVALFRGPDGRYVVLDARSGMAAPVSLPGDFSAAARGSGPNRFLLASERSDAVLYDASALASAGTMTGVSDAAWFPDGSRVELSRDGSAAFVAASGSRLRWPMPGAALSVSASGTDLVVAMPGGAHVVAKDAPAQAKLLRK